MIKAGFFSATKTLRRILASSGSRDIISRRSSWAGFRIMAAWSFWASFALIWNRNKPAKTTWSVTWFPMANSARPIHPLRRLKSPPSLLPVYVPGPAGTGTPLSGQLVPEQLVFGELWSPVEMFALYSLQLYLHSSEPEKPEPSPSENTGRQNNTTRLSTYKCIVSV